MILHELSKRQIKFIRGLIRSKSERTKNQLFIVEGLKAVLEALNSDYDIDFIVISEQFLEKSQDLFNHIYIRENKIPCYKTSNKVFDEISDTVTPQGILAVVKFKHIELEDLYKGNYLLIALDRIKDPGNMGTIIRTADAASAGAIIVGKGCVDVYNPKVIRATMGSIFHIPIVFAEDILDILLKIQRSGGQIITTHLKANIYYYDVDFEKPTVIVMGTEDDGVSEKVASISDQLVKIPMPGKAESLNVAIAHGIMVFEAVKQRNKARSFTCK